MPIDHLNLQASGKATDWYPVPRGMTKISASVKTATTATGSGWAVDLQWTPIIGVGSNNEVLDNAEDFSPSIQITATTGGKRNLGVSGAGNIRFTTSTADGAADQRAVVTFDFF